MKSLVEYVNEGLREIMPDFEYSPNSNRPTKVTRTKVKYKGSEFEVTEYPHGDIFILKVGSKDQGDLRYEDGKNVKYPYFVTSYTKNGKYVESNDKIEDKQTAKELIFNYLLK